MVGALGVEVTHDQLGVMGGGAIIECMTSMADRREVCEECEVFVCVCVCVCLRQQLW